MLSSAFPGVPLEPSDLAICVHCGHLYRSEQSDIHLQLPARLPHPTGRTQGPLAAPCQITHTSRALTTPRSLASPGTVALSSLPCKAVSWSCICPRRKQTPVHPASAEGSQTNPPRTQATHSWEGDRLLAHLPAKTAFL